MTILTLNGIAGAKFREHEKFQVAAACIKMLVQYRIDLIWNIVIDNTYETLLFSEVIGYL